MSPRRITMICSSTTWGGTEKWALRAAEHLAERGLDVTLAGRTPELFASYRAKTSLPFLQLPFRGDADLATVLRLAVHLRSQDAVILTRVRDYWLGGLAARLAGVPALLRLGIVRRLRDRYLLDRLRYGVFPSAAIVNAEPIASTLRETSWMKDLPVHVVANGVDVHGSPSPEEKANAREELGLSPDTLLILGVGRLALEKRWDWLLRASVPIAEHKANTRIVVLGEGDQRASLEQRTKEMGLEDVVMFPGHVSHTDKWLCAADVFTLPSRNEGISNALLEAMGCGLPSVITAAGGIRDHFHDGDELLLAETEDWTGYANRLLRVVESPALGEAISNRAVRAVRDQFSWERMTDRLLAILGELDGDPE